MYRCSICWRTAGFMPPSGKCPICGNVCTYIPVSDPPTIKKESRRVATQVPSENAGLVSPSSKKVETKRRNEKANNKSTVKKPVTATKAKWNWWAAIISFFIGTGVGMNQLGLERNAALIFGGVVGFIFGYYYKQIIVLAVIAFIAYSILKQ